MESFIATITESASTDDRAGLLGEAETLVSQNEPHLSIFERQQQQQQQQEEGIDTVQDESIVADCSDADATITTTMASSSRQEVTLRTRKRVRIQDQRQQQSQSDGMDFFKQEYEKLQTERVRTEKEQRIARENNYRPTYVSRFLTIGVCDTLLRRLLPVTWMECDREGGKNLPYAVQRLEELWLWKRWLWVSFIILSTAVVAAAVWFSELSENQMNSTLQQARQLDPMRNTDISGDPSHFGNLTLPVSILRDRSEIALVLKLAERANVWPCTGAVHDNDDDDADDNSEETTSDGLTVSSLNYLYYQPEGHCQTVLYNPGPFSEFTKSPKEKQTATRTVCAWNQEYAYQGNAYYAKLNDIHLQVLMNNPEARVEVFSDRLLSTTSSGAAVVPLMMIQAGGGVDNEWTYNISNGTLWTYVWHQAEAKWMPRITKWPVVEQQMHYACHEDVCPCLCGYHAGLALPITRITYASKTKASHAHYLLNARIEQVLEKKLVFIKEKDIEGTPSSSSPQEAYDIRNYEHIPVKAVVSYDVLDRSHYYPWHWSKHMQMASEVLDCSENNDTMRGNDTKVPTDKQQPHKNTATEEAVEETLASETASRLMAWGKRWQTRVQHVLDRVNTEATKAAIIAQGVEERALQKARELYSTALGTAAPGTELHPASQSDSTTDAAAAAAAAAVKVLKHLALKAHRNEYWAKDDDALATRCVYTCEELHKRKGVTRITIVT